MNAPPAAAGSPFGQPPNAAVPNAFPREYIGTGETIIYETRPSVVPFLIGGIAFLVLGLIITSSVAGLATSAPGAFGFVAFLFIVLPILTILLGYLRWMKTAYAITDKRAMQSRGIFSRNTSDCQYSKIQNVTLHQGVFERLFGYGHLIFQTAGITSIRERDVIMGGGVFWLGIKDPVNTRRFVHEVSDYLTRQQKISEFQDMARVLQASGATMTPGAGLKCPKCGAPWTPGSKFCNNCGSPMA